MESAPVSVRLAIQEGWYTKNGSKWQTMTRQMLMYRAASMWTNAYAPELSMGMRTVEEQQDVYTEYEEVTEQVEREKSANANRKRIGMDLVNTETGEISHSEDTGDTSASRIEKAAENANNAPNPGF